MASSNNNRLIPYGGESGISLLLVSIIIAVVGLLLIPALQIYSIGLKNEHLAQNKVSGQIAASALNKYLLLHGNYPVPSAPGNNMNQDAFGKVAVEPGSGWPDCQVATTPLTDVCSTTADTLSGGAVLIGVLPYKELGIPLSSVLDANKNLLTYAVTDDLTVPGTYSETGGQIIVEDNAGADIYTGAAARSHFIVVSHGDDARGAYGQNGTRNFACSDDNNSNDFENCDRDGTFRSNLVPGTIDTEIYETAGADHFDDYLVEKNSSSSGIWSFVANPAVSTDLNIRDKVGGNVSTGNCDGMSPCIPKARLDIYPEVSTGTNIPAARATRVNTSRFCGRGRAAGDTAGSGPYNCIDDYSAVTNTASTTVETSCIGNACPGATAAWGINSQPPWFTPELIVGTPPTMLESGVYWSASSGDHENYHRGNGIACVGNRALNGIYDYDETCNHTSNVTNTTKTRLFPTNCPTGEYARGIDTNGRILCSTPASNR